jgi:hypothetical protein
MRRLHSVIATLLAAVTLGVPAVAHAATTPRPIEFASAAFYRGGTYGGAGLDDNSSAMADLDGDGKQDVLYVAPWYGSNVAIQYGNGDGSFRSPAQNLWVGLFNSNVIVGDFNRDGRVDFVVTGASSFTVVINDGNRHYHAGSSYLLQQSPFQNTGVASDFNGDGLIDLVLKTPLGLQTMLGNGNGTFRYGPFTYVPGVVGALTSIDGANLNRDARRDIVASDGGTQQVIALLNNGDGRFSWKSSVSVPVLPSTVKAGDLTHQGFDSVVVLPEVNAPGWSVASVLNDGNGNLQAPRYYNGGFGNPAGTLGDFNADGVVDVVSVNTFSGDIVVLAGVGDGTFVPGGTFKTSINAQTPVVGDFNRDGRSDIAVPTNCPGLSGLFGNVCLAVLVNRS